VTGNQTTKEEFEQFAAQARLDPDGAGSAEPPPL